MSCTVLAVPYALAWVIGTVVTAIQAAHEVKQQEQEFEPLVNDISQAIFCDDIHVITESTLMEKSLETPFMDKEILIKTLEEHGVKNITEELGKIRGEVETYSLSFEKMESDKPYFVTIGYLKGNKPEEKLNDLNSEYALNVQEEAYLSIIEKLKDNNMEIEEEEVLEDNTIVLTINLEN